MNHILDVLRDIDAPAYHTLAQKFRMYAACVVKVDTGYFKKRGDPMVPALSAESVKNKEVQPMNVPLLIQEAFSKLTLPNSQTSVQNSKLGPSNHAKRSWFMKLLMESPASLHDVVKKYLPSDQRAMVISSVVRHLEQHLSNNNNNNNNNRNNENMSYSSKTADRQAEKDTLFTYSPRDMDLPPELE